MKSKIQTLNGMGLKKMALKRMSLQKMVGLFMIYLILILPISSASALAGTITISKNSGQKGLPGFLDAQDDIWTVEATISNLQSGETVAPENVQIKLGANQKNFNSCSATDAGAVCQYLEPLTGGIAPGAYTFNILYTPTGVAGAVGTADSKTSIINADGAPPEITFTQGNAKQEGDTVKLSFTINDNANPPCVGLAKYSIHDADSGAVLLAKEDFPEKSCNPYVFAEDTAYNGYLPSASLPGEGVRRVKIIAEDRLGHSAVSSVVSFLTDFVKPEPLEMNFTGFGKFLGVNEQASPLVVKIREKSNLPPTAVLATAVQTTLDKTPANSCTRTKADPNVWECIWSTVRVDPVSSISVLVSATDAIGNTVETALAQNFVTDTDIPVVEYFGPLLEFNGVGHVRSGQNTIVARIREQGSGMAAQNVLAQLGQLGGIKSPDECVPESDLFVCYWSSSASFSSTSEDVRISLVKVVDNVGNQASLPQRDLIVDVTPPLLEKIELFGVSSGAAKSYFQSGDILRISATVSEVQGLFWLIDLRNVVNDAETLFPATKLNAAGWQTFKGDDVCTQNEEKSWACSFETAAMKSGLVKNALVTLQLRDAAGNLAVLWPETVNVEKRSSKNDEGKYAFDILAVKDEENPDYWSAGTAKPLLAFVDLDAMVMPLRIPIQISLKTDNLNARALAVELVSCDPKQEGEPSEGGGEAAGTAASASSASPEIGRKLIYGNIFPDGSAEPKPTIMLEFSAIADVRTFFGIPNDDTFGGVNIPYTCQLKIYSRLGNTALGNAETQDVDLLVPFAFSALGGIDENLAQKIKEMTESDFMKFADVLEYFNDAIAWINYILSFMQIINDVYTIYSLYNAASLGIAQGYEKTGFLSTVGSVLRGSCAATETLQSSTWKIFEYIGVLAQVLNCGYGAAEENQLGFYGWWQKQVLDGYNFLSGRDLIGMPAKTPYENVIVSMAAVCVPGLIYNVHKMREIHCRKIFCYAKEIPAGLATYDSCDKLYDLQICEFWTGPAVDLIPLLGGFADLGKIIKNAGANPLGLIKVTEIVACAALCFTEQTGGVAFYTCKATTALNKVVNIINTIVASIDQRPGLTDTAYCDAIEDIDFDALTGQTQVAVK
ncbi:hypothetical protein HY495_01170 [Candidatus Woesearchaeota archaeon]|nr:hypothetical protein [Candidatus Woesearchaeota archaeon]